MAVVRQKKEGGCCLFKLFLILVILAAMLIACVIGGVYWGKSKLASMASPKPLPLTYPGATTEEVTAIKMKGAVLPTTPGALPPLKSFTDVELNTLIGNDPEFVGLKNRLFVKIVDGKATLLISLPVTFDKATWETGTVTPGTPFVNAVANVTGDPSSTEAVRFHVTGLKFESKAISTAQADWLVEQINQGLIQASVKQATEHPGQYMTLEGNSFVIQPGANTVPTTTIESSDVAPAPDSAAPAPGAIPTAPPAPNSNSSH